MPLSCNAPFTTNTQDALAGLVAWPVLATAGTICQPLGSLWASLGLRGTASAATVVLLLLALLTRPLDRQMGVWCGCADVTTKFGLTVFAKCQTP